MLATIFGYAVQYACYLLELGLVLCLLRWGRGRRGVGLTLFLAAMLVVGVVRTVALYRFGVGSLQYAYSYWVTDVFLVLGAFLLVCSFFRQACAHQEKLWPLLRFLLVSTFILTAGISFLALSRNYTHLFTRFIVEFQQNLYFTCLVINTLLYILIQQFQTADDELSLLVCGLGIQFAGPAANFALMYLTPGGHYAGSLLTHLFPLCTLGMLLTWFYALARMPKKAAVRVPGNTVSGLVAAAGREA